mmetsp:Transcript_106748/g.300046  ORF Transcript_106748/g.300046 Transcript_106748/m.300046 type:complete len:261 (+) Transcript_106748:843-1625(+)
MSFASTASGAVETATAASSDLRSSPLSTGASVGTPTFGWAPRQAVRSPCKPVRTSPKFCLKSVTTSWLTSLRSFHMSRETPAVTTKPCRMASKVPCLPHPVASLLPESPIASNVTAASKGSLGTRGHDASAAQSFGFALFALFASRATFSRSAFASCAVKEIPSLTPSARSRASSTTTCTSSARTFRAAMPNNFVFFFKDEAQLGNFAPDRSPSLAPSLCMCWSPALLSNVHPSSDVVGGVLFRCSCSSKAAPRTLPIPA